MNRLRREERGTEKNSQKCARKMFIFNPTIIYDIMTSVNETITRTLISSQELQQIVSSPPPRQYKPAKLWVLTSTLNYAVDVVFFC